MALSLFVNKLIGKNPDDRYLKFFIFFFFVLQFEFSFHFWECVDNFEFGLFGTLKFHVVNNLMVICFVGCGFQIFYQLIDFTQFF